MPIDGQSEKPEKPQPSALAGQQAIPTRTGQHTCPLLGFPVFLRAKLSLADLTHYREVARTGTRQTKLGSLSTRWAIGGLWETLPQAIRKSMTQF